MAATPSDKVDRRGLLCVFAGAGGFPALTNPGCSPAQFDGYPNGRRLGDDVTDIEIAALIGLPIDHLIPSGIQRAYSLLALGGPSLPDSGPVSALKFGADGVPVNDANGGLFGSTFPYLNTPERGQQVGRRHDRPHTRNRSTRRSRARHRRDRGRGRPAGRPAGWWSLHHRRPRPARYAPRSTR